MCISSLYQGSKSINRQTLHDDPYTVSITVNNITMNGIAGDITTTVEVMVDDINNGTDITCAIPQNTDHNNIVIYIASEILIKVVYNVISLYYILLKVHHIFHLM